LVFLFADNANNLIWQTGAKGIIILLSIKNKSMESSFLFAGFIGGIARGIVGYIKYRNSYRNVEFKPVYFLSSVAVSGIVGLQAAWVIRDLGINIIGLEKLTPAVALVLGYAGGDFIENLFKILTGRVSIYGIK
jgi:hypothetical protein